MTLPDTQLLRSRYLELLKLGLLDLLGPTTSQAVYVEDPDPRLICELLSEENRGLRVKGLDWPLNGTTLIGLERLTNLQLLIEQVVKEGIPGDAIECGVWRGGATIFMREVLDSLGDDRRVWAADSFAGLPAPDAAYPADADLFLCNIDFLAVPRADVERNFSRFNVDTQNVVFLEGFFRETLPTLGDETWSLVRLDGDLYESTILAMTHLYPNLSPGGFLIVDDYHTVDACRSAIGDYCLTNGFEPELVEIDGSAVYWQKNETSPA